MTAKSPHGQAIDIAFDDDIPRTGPELFIKRLKSNESLMVTILGTKIRGLWVHWNPDGNFSEPHFVAGCPSCEKKMAKRWKGFIHAFDRTAGGSLFMELTPRSAAQLERECQGLGGYRGRVVTFSRGAKANSRISISVQAYGVDPKILPPEVDARRSIMKLWGISDVEIARALDLGDDDTEIEDGGE